MYIYNNNIKSLSLTIKSEVPNFNPDINIYIYNISSSKINKIFFSKGKHIYFLKNLEESIFYIDNILNMQNIMEILKLKIL